MSNHKETIVNGKAVLGIEFGSTRIKAVLVGEDNTPGRMTGRTVWRTGSGLIRWMISGQGLRTAIQR